MKHIETILEFDQIKTKWAELAQMDVTKEQIQNIIPYLKESELLRMQKQTTEARGMIETCGTPPIPGFANISQLLDTAKKEGHLTPEQIETIGNTFIAVRRLKDYLNRCKNYDFSLAYYSENLNSCPEISREIEQQIRNGRIEDHASTLLFSIRREIEQQDTRLHEKANQILHSQKKYMADSYVTMRSGHLCLPVKAQYRSQIEGSVIDKSAAGSTFFIEPTAISRLSEKIQLLKIDEENEELRICYTLTALILEEEETILQNFKTTAVLDFAFSKGKLSIDYGGIEPRINTDRTIQLTDARHPLIPKNKCVPISFSIGGSTRGIIITGPNTGGKTVTIKTVALCALMSQCGLHVPCGDADICMNANILCDIGDGQNLTDNLSTFSAHLKNILYILENVTEESLVILDELGSGTDPVEGAGIAIAVLQELLERNALFLVTTHYAEVKLFGEAQSAITNARMDFDPETLSPLYHLIMGESGESCAFSIAKRLGMPEHILRNAAIAAYGEERQQTNGIAQAVISASALSTCETETISDEVPTPAHPYPKRGSIIQKKKEPRKVTSAHAASFQLGDSVLIYPDKKIGIVCQCADEKGILRIQLPDRKIYINHKRLKLHVAAAELYPEDYDFSIIFDTVENRKLRHQMSRKFTEGEIVEE